MSAQQDEVTKLMRDGTYFDQARQWYETLYISPIAERSFFLAVAGLAGLIALFTLIGLASFFPVTEQPPLLVASEDMDNSQPHLVPLAPADTPVDRGILTFFVSQYVLARESYALPNYAQNVAFVGAHSDGPTFGSYQALYDAKNPSNPATILGKSGRRVVTLQSITLNDRTEPATASVKFSTALEGMNSTTRTQWTATMSYYYSVLTFQEAADPRDDEPSLVTQDPQFQVVNYAVTQTP